MVTATLCFFMVSWIFYGPATFWLGFKAVPHDATISLGHLKYTGEFLIVMLHHLPAGLWSLFAPFQLCTPFRKKYPKVHRAVGYLFFATVPCITLGAGLIFARNINFDFGSSEWGLSPVKESGWYLTLFLKGLSLYFAVSAFVAIKKAREKNFEEHFRYVCRHIACGLWVAILRVYALLRAPTTLDSIKASFYDGTLIALLISLVGCEVYLYFNRPTAKHKTP